MHVNLDNQISLHPKKGIYLFSWTKITFSRRKEKTKTNNLYTIKKLNLWLKVPHIEKLCNIFTTRWPPYIHCFLQSLLVSQKPMKKGLLIEIYQLLVT